MVSAAGYELVTIPARGFVRRQPWKNIPVLWALLVSSIVCRRIIREFNPDVAVGTGGYVTGPVIRAAHRAGVPTLIHEQNRRPGLTTRWLSRIADVACVAFAETAGMLARPERVKTTGNPLDPAGPASNIVNIRTALGLSTERPIVLITGGSQGAQSINANVESHLRTAGLPDNFQVIWQTGAADFARYEHFHDPARGIVVQPFLADLASVMAAVDLVIARAGALTIAEISACGLPAIYVPYPFAAADHQTSNAQALVEAGAGVMVRDAELGRADLLQRAAAMLADAEGMKQMSENAGKLGRPDATEKIVDEILHLAELKRS
jgi:UDP-N-acetylglucosamine--N-acetylmuramyl-(pentapeptide) pyrophosphoryl-undecaprenol N-acetylglucosamine transferase